MQILEGAGDDLRLTRSPGDVVRLGAGATLFLIATLFALWGTVGGIEESAFRLVNAFPDYLADPISAVMQAGALWFVPVAAVVALLARQGRLAMKLAAGGMAVWVLARAAKAVIDRPRPAQLLAGFAERAETTGALGIPSGHAAGAAVLATIAAPYVPRSWRRALWALALLVGLSRMYVGAHLPLDIVAGLALGWVVGSAINLLVGTPRHPIPFRDIEETLAEAGLAVEDLETLDLDARGSVPISARTQDGRRVFIKLVDNEHRNADALFKAWRYVIFRDVEDEAPFATAKHLVEHEAYVLLLTHRAGVRSPEVLLASPVSRRAGVLVTEQVEGVGLDRFGGVIDDALGRAIWDQVALLHRARIAHRDLRAANILIDEDRRPWLIDFSFSEAASTPRERAEDIAELLVSLSLHIPAEAVVEAAVEACGPQAVEDALPYVQPLALSSVTRALARRHPGHLEKVRTTLESRLQVTREQERLARARPRNLLWLALGAGALYYLLPQVGELSDSVVAISEVHPGWALAAAAASVASYVMAAVVVAGSTVRHLSGWQLLLLQAAATFLNRITPKAAGAIAVTERFLERNGHTRPQAVASTGLVYFVGVVVHVIMLGTSIVLYGLPVIRPANVSVGQVVLVVILVVVVFAGLAFVPRLKYAVLEFVRAGHHSIVRLRHHPAKLAMLLLGSAGITLAYSLSLHFSLLSLGVSVGFEQVLLAYLAGSALASAAPTPGGLGATEAALAAALTTFAVPISLAIAGVLVFRFLTFWLPTLPAVFAYRYMLRHDLI